MASPFTTKYSKTFDRKLTRDEKVEAFFYIDGFIRNKEAKNVRVVENCLSYKGSTSAFNWNIFVTVDKGEFKIKENDGKSIIEYEIFMYQLFIFVSIAAIIFYVISMNYWLPIMCFGWLGGMNYILSLARHSSMFDEIKDGIDVLLKTGDAPSIEND